MDVVTVSSKNIETKKEVTRKKNYARRLTIQM